MMQTDTEDAEARASIYWWLSTVFAKELEADSLNAYFGEPGLAFIDGLSAALPGTEEPASLVRLKHALVALKLMEQPRLELAADFAQAFLGDNRTSALPYASVYLSADGLLFQKPHDEMLALLTSQGLAVTEQFKEPADHLAIMLDYLGNQALRLIAAKTDSERTALYREQQAFIEERLLSWVPEFKQRCERITASGFYPAVAEFLCDFLKAERAYLAAQLDATTQAPRVS